MHINPKGGIGTIPKYKIKSLVQKLQNDLSRAEERVRACCHATFITSADYTADHQHSVQTQWHGFTKLPYLDFFPNQINNTDNLDSGQVPVTFNRDWLMFGQSKWAENEMWSAFYPLTKSLFSFQSHRRGWFWSIFIRPRPHKFVRTSSCVWGQVFSLPLALDCLFTFSHDSPDRHFTV